MRMFTLHCVGKKNQTSLLTRQSKGFTLVEMVVTIAISTILMLVITFTIWQIYQQNAYQFAQTNEVDSARRGLGVWVRDVREMAFADNGAYPIVTAEANRFVFYSDVDRDAFVELVEYRLASTTLTKFSTNPTGYPPIYSTSTPSETFVLSEYIQNVDQGVPMFRYYNNAGAEILNPQAMISDIRYITMSIIVNIDPIRSPGEFMLKGSATPRNLKDNL